MKMQMKSKIIIFLITPLFILFFISSCKSQSRYLNPVLADIGISISGFENFILDEKENNNIVAHDGEAILTISLIKNINTVQAKRFVNEKIAVLESQYEIRNAPYQGEVTREIVCPDQFKPIQNVINNSYSLVNYKLYSTKSLTYGVCVSDLIVYRAFLGFFYCDNNRLFQIEIFVPIENERKFNETLKKFSSFEC